MILMAVLTAAVLAGGGYFPTDIGNRLTQTVSAAKKDSDKKDDTSESEGSVLDQATLMYQQYNYDEAIKLLKELHDKTIGGEFEYTFVEDEISAMYEKDRLVARIYSVFTLVSILISSMGLFSLSLFDIQQRYKEIAIRKVNGATTGAIMNLLLRKYYKLLGFSFLIATPLSWLAITRYLENFANKAPLSWWIFAIAFLITAGISLLTLIWQIRKAARTNPAKAIKTE